MKKLLCCIFAVATLCCVGATGCEKDNIEYTAEKPIIYYEYVIRDNWEELEEDEIKSTLSGCDPIKRFEFYKDFSEYYIDNLKGSGAYLLYRSNEKQFPSYEGSFGYYREKETGDLILEEAYHHYDSELGAKPYDGKVPYTAETLYLNIYIKSVDRVNLNELKLEFGKLKDKFYNHEKFINIYSDEVCFATCYYNNYVSIPREWFENYFKTNLIYGDKL